MARDLTIENETIWFKVSSVFRVLGQMGLQIKF